MILPSRSRPAASSKKAKTTQKRKRSRSNVVWPTRIRTFNARSAGMPINLSRTHSYAAVNVTAVCATSTTIA